MQDTDKDKKETMWGVLELDKSMEAKEKARMERIYRSLKKNV